MKRSFIKEITIYQLILYIFILTFFIISFLLLVLSPILNYTCKKTFQLSNISLILIDLFILLIFFTLLKRFGKSLILKIDSYAFQFMMIGSIILFLGQIYISYNIYFLTGWDAGNYVIPAAKKIASGLPLDTLNSYFSRYPNNITLVWFFSEILKVNARLGIFNYQYELMSIIIVNCFISCLTGILTYKCMEKIIDRKWAFMTWGVYVLLIGTSPWVVITYSDPFVLFLPILIFFIYIITVTGNLNFFRWFLIGFLSFTGYQIKPQVMIVFIAIVLIEIWKFSFRNKAERKKVILSISGLTVALILTSVVSSTIYKQTGFQLNRQSAFGLTHFAMMGLNAEKDGVYSQKDVDYSGSFSTSSERQKANLKVIKERLHAFGIVDYLKFSSKKILVNYGDGTFAWSEEGHFYMKTYENRMNGISSILKNIYYSSGTNYKKTSTFEQAVWIAVIILMLGLIFMNVKMLDNKIAVLILSILGLTMFELIFEARARYLYLYTPFYIILSMLGLKNVIVKIVKLAKLK